ncbi:MAG: amino acid ABC transporter ATP-binding protein [Streptococcaceae bacterium]|jgi:ABC-type polar amino acid transport system ATPase subunit|nr:amino acid ABC transporter ATP-binding protein [Streptococcaceae bacterium]MCH4176356.1 amino acid ABC transporter ATP-binding protein [Streptococcaceae bacterium]
MIKIENLKKSFHNTEVLRDVTLNVEKGKVTAILGPSGSGKTTLLRCINFLEHANQGMISIGDVKVNCEKVEKNEIYKLRNKTAFVFQSFNLFNNMTALENVMEGLVFVKKIKKDVAREKSIAALKKVGLGERLDYYPCQLSGGQQQRVSIARAMVLEPDVILFDEPTSALDPELVNEVLQTMVEIAQSGVTMIVVTHEIDFAREVADNVIFMADGYVLETGPAKQVIDNPQKPRTQFFLNKIEKGFEASMDGICEQKK